MGVAVVRLLGMGKGKPMFRQSVNMWGLCSPEVLIEPGVEEGVTTGGGHRYQVTAEVGEGVPPGVQCSAVQCSAVQCSAVQCSAVQCSAVQCSAVALPPAVQLQV
jgi:hypothetical protein